MAPNGESWLVSGASKGVGLNIVTKLLQKEDGRVVIGGARSPDKYQELKDLSKQYGDRFHVLKLDISKSESVQEAAKEVEKLLPNGLDYLINNAGLSEDIKPPLETPDSDLETVMLTNAVGPIFMYKYFEHLIGKSKRKTLINVASNFGSITLAQKPLKDKKQRGPLDNHQIVYKASKAAVNMETIIIANDKREDGWTVLSVHPGVAATDMGNRPQEFGEEFKPECTPEESASGLLKVIENASPMDTGNFYTYTGESLPW